MLVDVSPAPVPNARVVATPVLPEHPSAVRQLTRDNF